MYLKEKNVRLLRIKNIIFTFIGVFSVFVCGFYIISEFTYYRDNPYLAWHAKSMASSIAWVIIGAILLIEALISRNLIGKATFYSGYFEGSLDGLCAVVSRNSCCTSLQLVYGYGEWSTEHGSVV